MRFMGVGALAVGAASAEYAAGSVDAAVGAVGAMRACAVVSRAVVADSPAPASRCMKLEAEPQARG